MQWTAKDARRARPYTTAVLEAVDEGALDKDTLLADLLGYLSESEVEDFVRKNDLLVAVGMAEDEEEEYDPLDDFNYVGSRHHY
jgi:hypothetical protein